MTSRFAPKPTAIAHAAARDYLDQHPNTDMDFPTAYKIGLAAAKASLHESSLVWPPVHHQAISPAMKATAAAKEAILRYDGSVKPARIVGRCKAITATAKPCRRKALPDTDRYCAAHAKEAAELA